MPVLGGGPGHLPKLKDKVILNVGKTVRLAVEAVGGIRNCSVHGQVQEP